MVSRRITLAALTVIAASAPAHAAVVISTAATQNMSCADGACVPTTTDAILNVADLEKLLASGATKVTTTGAGVQANKIVIDGVLTWTSANILTLDAYRSITINKPVSIDGLAGLTILTGDGGSAGSLSFANKGRLVFASLSSNLTINGVVYSLAGTIQALAEAVAANPSGNFALADNYDANHDGTYKTSPVALLKGTINGLGNTIANLRVKDRSGADNVGLIGEMDGATVSDINLTAEKISGRQYTGGLSGLSQSSHVSGVHTGGVVSGGSGTGGVLGVNSQGKVSMSSSTAAVHAYAGYAGGLVGMNLGGIDQSFATGKVVNPGDAGGLVGLSEDGGSVLTIIEHSYAKGNVGSSGDDTTSGGFVALNEERCRIATSYSTGKFVGVGDRFGGFLGEDESGDEIVDSYWDTDTSDTDNGLEGDNEPGITGLTTAQLQSGLPTGFDPKFWAENPNINGGLPYLINNPPPK